MYQAQLTPWWMLQPDLQYVFNPGGGVLNPDGSLRRNALVIRVRSLINFWNTLRSNCFFPRVAIAWRYGNKSEYRA